jgi:hypothetical protein
MTQGACLYFHSPCFDGIVSGVLAWDFLETSQHWEFNQLRTVNYDARSTWLSSALETPCAVVDFLYHPQAQFWADHHLTTFLTKEAEEDFAQRKSKWLIYDEESGSCAKLLWTHLAESFSYQNPRYEEMVRWADKIDAARYESVNEAILGDTPALRISRSLAFKSSAEYCEHLVKELRVTSLEEVAQLAEVRERSEQVQSLIKSGLARFAERSKLEDGIVVFNLDSQGVIVNRYTPYYFFPDARYSIGIVKSSGGAKITAMRNPWREFPSVPLGKIFEKVGGGGHQRVGSVLLNGEQATRAPSLLESLTKEIRERDATHRGASPHDQEF